jgi:hypothetical protein
MPSTGSVHSLDWKRHGRGRTIRTVDATLLDIMECLVVDVRVVEHRLGRNITDVQGSMFHQGSHASLYTLYMQSG